MWEATKERACDAFVTLFIFSPLVVFYWSSTWHLLDIYLLPSNQTASACISLGISYIIMITSFFTQDFLNGNVKADNVLTFTIVSRLFTYILAFAVVNNWRGLWMLLDIYTGKSLLSGGISTAIATVAMITLRSYRNVIYAPGSWSLDVVTDSYFTIISRFRTRKGTILYVLDVMFGVVVLSTLLLVVWRGEWLVLEHSIAPDSLLWQGVIASILGNLLVVVLIVIQHPARKLASHLHTTSPRLQILFEDGFVFVVCFSAVTYWLGLWQLLLALFSGISPHIAQWMVHIVGFGFMMVLRVCTSLQFNGYFVDGEFPEGVGIVQTPTYYRTFIMTSSRDRQTLKEARQRAATGLSIPVDATKTTDNTLDSNSYTETSKLVHSGGLKHL